MKQSVTCLLMVLLLGACCSHTSANLQRGDNKQQPVVHRVKQTGSLGEKAGIEKHEGVHHKRNPALQMNTPDGYSDSGEGAYYGYDQPVNSGAFKRSTGGDGNGKQENSKNYGGGPEKSAHREKKFFETPYTHWELDENEKRVGDVDDYKEKREDNHYDDGKKNARLYSGWRSGPYGRGGRAEQEAHAKVQYLDKRNEHLHHLKRSQGAYYGRVGEDDEDRKKSARHHDRESREEEKRSPHHHEKKDEEYTPHRNHPHMAHKRYRVHPESFGYLDDSEWDQDKRGQEEGPEHHGEEKRAKEKKDKHHGDHHRRYRRGYADHRGYDRKRPSKWGKRDGAYTYHTPPSPRVSRWGKRASRWGKRTPKWGKRRSTWGKRNLNHQEKRWWTPHELSYQAPARRRQGHNFFKGMDKREAMAHKLLERHYDKKRHMSLYEAEGRARKESRYGRHSKYEKKHS